MIVKILDSAEGILILHDNQVSILKKDVEPLITFGNLSRAAAVHKNFLICASDQKNICLYSLKERRDCGISCIVEKTVTCIYSSHDDKIYISDKFGDVFVVDFDESKENFNFPKIIDHKQAVLGHVSIVTDLLVYKNFIVTADRDEKIRLSNQKFPFVIEDFYLEHSEFVSGLTLYDDGEQLVSVGGDFKVNYYEGKGLVNSIQLDKIEDSAPLQIVSHDKVLAIIFDECPKVLLIDDKPTWHELPANPTSICFHNSTLYISTVDGTIISLLNPITTVCRVTTTPVNRDFWRRNLLKLRGQDLLEHRKRNHDDY